MDVESSRCPHMDNVTLNSVRITNTKKEIKKKKSKKTDSQRSSPFPRSSGSAWTTTALPTIEFGPVRGICKKNRKYWFTIAVPEKEQKHIIGTQL